MLATLRITKIAQSKSSSIGMKRFFSNGPLPTTSKVVRYHETGTPKTVLKVETENLPSKLNDNQILVKILAAPINPADLNMIEGVYGTKSVLPAVGGNEGVGIVVAVGSNVKNISVSDHVIPAKQGLGTWRNFGVFNGSDFIKVPKEIPKEYAATVAVNPCTAVRLLDDFVNLKAGDTIIQNGANSAVGQAVTQIANSRGIKTICVVRNRPEFATTVERLKAIGGYMVVTDDYIKTPQFTRLMENEPKPKLALNCIGGDNATNVARVLDNNGVMVTYGGMSKKPVTIPTSLFIFKNIQLKGFWLTKWVETHSPAERQKMLDGLFDMIRDQKLKLMMETYNFEKFHQAIENYYEPGRSRKIVLVMP